MRGHQRPREVNEFASGHTAGKAAELDFFLRENKRRKDEREREKEKKWDIKNFTPDISVKKHLAAGNRTFGSNRLK